MAMVLGQTAHRGTWRMVDKLVALTPLMARRLRAAGLDGRQIAVRPSWTTDPGEPVSPGKDFLYLGRLEEAKGINLLLEAWRLRKTRGTRRLRIAGTGPLEEHVRSIALIEDDVDYLGHLDRREVPAAIQQCGVVVIPSLCHEEGGPLVFVEALAHGRPVMVNHGTSTASMVSDELAWSVQPTVDSWRRAIEMIRQDDVEARGMAARKLLFRDLLTVSRAKVIAPDLRGTSGGHHVSPHRTVAFVQEWLPRYRLPFFNLLRDLLSTQRIELRLYYGQPAGAIAKRSDAAGLPWACQVVNSHVGPTRVAARVAASPASRPGNR